MFDTEEYCLEVKKKLLQSLQSDLGLAADTLFMHDAIFVEGDPESPFVAPDKSNIKKPWWDDDEYLAQYDENMAPEMKVKKYLKDSYDR